MSRSIAIPDAIVINKIYFIRGQKVMIDRDLADLYGVQTKRLKEAVRRNRNRFPEDFMFEMNKQEFEYWRKENIIGPEDRQGLRYAPYCFTEQGVTMLSCVLNSRRAIRVNIQIIRIFTRLREMILTGKKALLKDKDILLKFDRLEGKVVQHDKDIKVIFEYIRRLFTPKTEPLRRIGFRRREED